MNTSYSTSLTDNQWQVIEIINAQERTSPWQTVYYYFRKWKFEGFFDDIMDTLHSLVRKLIGREESPSMGIIASRSVKTSHYADPSCKEIDGNKKVKGRKEHIVVDTLGLPMAVAVHEANLHDSKGAPKVIERLEHKFPRLEKILADGGYYGTLGDWVSEKFGWIAERSFAWLENLRRLTIDYEFLANTAEATV